MQFANILTDIVDLHCFSKQVSEYDREIHCIPAHGAVRKSHRTLTVVRQQEDNYDQFSLPHQNDCKTRNDAKYCKAKTDLPETMGATINNESNALERTAV